MTGMNSSWTEIRAERPGISFADSFLLGNGWFGASLGFQPERESILLSHTAFWSGAPARSHGRPGAPAAFRKARELSLRGDHAGAYDALKDFIGEKENYGTNLPVGRLIAEQNLSRPEQYRRSLDLTDGTARCSFLHAGGCQTRLARCTGNPEMLELLFRDSAPMRIAFSLEGICITVRKTEGDLYLFEAEARENIHSDGTRGVRLAGGFRLRTNGTVKAERDRIMAEGTEIGLRLTMVTDYAMTEEDCRNPEGPDGLRAKVRDRLSRTVPAARTERNGTSALPDGSGRGSDAGRKSFSAAGIPAGEDCPEKKTVPRIEIEGEEAINRQALFGHYLIRAAMTCDSPLPPHLQGVWNDEEACRLGWSNDYHLDVNTQMNLWCLETLGEGKRLDPLFRFLLLRLIPEGRKTARGYYGLPGAVAELSTNCFGYAAPYWGRPLAPCPACGFWLCENVIRHGLNHPEDTDFLKKTALPALEPFVEFLLAYVTSDGKGSLVGGPSVSPENGFLTGEGRTVYASMGTTFENEQMRILLDGYVRICGLARTEDEMAKRAAETLKRLPAPGTDDRGEIREYAHGLQASVPHHRHMSHLSGLYPGRSINPEKPELAEAAEKTIQARILPEEEYESTPWARVMLGLYEARLGHGDQALTHLEYMMKRHGSPTLLMMHPAIPGTLNPRPVWELDGNTGFTEVVLEMLAQGSEKQLRLLPALPAGWKKGRIRGLQAGPWMLEEVCWEMPDCIRVRLRGRPGSRLDIHWKGTRTACTIPESGELTLDGESWKT